VVIKHHRVGLGVPPSACGASLPSRGLGTLQTLAGKEPRGFIPTSLAMTLAQYVNGASTVEVWGGCF